MESNDIPTVRKASTALASEAFPEETADDSSKATKRPAGSMASNARC